MKKYDLEKDWEKVGIDNEFMFSKVIQNPKLCKGLLERIFPDIVIEHIQYIDTEKVIDEDKDAKSIRLDVYVKDEESTIYNIELQVANTLELPKRSRYYQSMIDTSLLNKGEYYAKLNRTYIIFICLDDVFGKGRHQYTFANICQEDTSVSLGDEAIKIFLNASGVLDDVNPELKNFLDYVANAATNDPFTEALEQEVTLARKNRTWRREYMTMLMRDKENQEIGRREGRREGRWEGRQEGRREERKESILNMVIVCKKYHIPDDQIANELQSVYYLTREEAEQYIKQSR
ncbi:MAG: Rpn family recombination-promoting nuclease/putative transposase [Clostridiales bacterium]|nr:Rpn family recombination-promoting nuclease/putative transposase [Clostridiales bacterium]